MRRAAAARGCTGARGSAPLAPGSRRRGAPHPRTQVWAVLCGAWRTQPVAARLGAVHAVQPACAGAASITASISAMLCGLHLVDHRQSVCSACRDGVGTAALSRAIKDAAAAGVKVGEARRLLKLMQASAAVAAVCGCSR